MLLLDAFTRLLEAHPDRPLFTFVNVHGRDQASLTVRELAAQAGSIAGYLRRRAGLGPGDRAVLVYPPGLAFVAALLGCLHAGVVPVPVYPPNPLKLQHDLTGFRGLVDDCDARAILTSTEFNRARQVGGLKDMLFRTGVQWPALPWHATDRIGIWATPPRHPAAPDDVAVLQYTSGSTSTPKGVQITHANIMGELADNARSIGVGPDTVGVGWVPQYHDLGLICCIMSVLAGSGRFYMLSPLAFLQRPAVWFEVLHRVRASHTCSPNFGLGLVTRKTTPEQRAGWDLRALKVLLCAAEPLRRDTIAAFLDAFACTGLRPGTLVPAYGLAEHTVSVAVAARGWTCFDRAALAAGEAVPRPDDGPEGLALYSHGPITKADSRVRIVDPGTRRPLADGHVGEIWVDSPTKAAGYHGRPDESREVFAARVEGDDDPRGYLRTGDLGFFHTGELFIAGRLKDVVIVRGRNYYPHDIEATVQAAHPQVRPGSVVACGLGDEHGEHGIGLVIDLRERGTSPVEARVVAESARAAVERDHQLACLAIAVGVPGTVLKTTSGKLRRRATRDLLLAAGTSFLHRQHHEPNPA
jgi:acyl-CoA synthetase (AMP-forming)/AMP-acid ligase II